LEDEPAEGGVGVGCSEIEADKVWLVLVLVAKTWFDPATEVGPPKMDCPGVEG
jgi:hypothetical protein